MHRHTCTVRLKIYTIYKYHLHIYKVIFLNILYIYITAIKIFQHSIYVLNCIIVNTQIQMISILLVILTAWFTFTNLQHYDELLHYCLTYICLKHLECINIINGHYVLKYMNPDSNRHWARFQDRLEWANIASMLHPLSDIQSAFIIFLTSK